MTRIVVGVDGSPCGEQALRWAVGYARSTGASIEAILSWNEHPLLAGVAETLGGGVPLDQVESQARAMLDAAVDGVAVSDLDISRKVESGSPADVLVAAASDADLLVVGRHGGAGVLHLGSVSAHCARHAACPVVVVPEK
ncbi:MAG TPA: universal stress protein [Acidimicrobiia bacterium]